MTNSHPVVYKHSSQSTISQTLPGSRANKSRPTGLLKLATGPPATAATLHADIWDEATLGEGPLTVMIHGFPDFWYGWRHPVAGAVLEVTGRGLSH